MQLVIFVGIQASGKSSFFKERFADTHVRINLDMLKTRHRERLLVDACLEAKQPFVIDNTNVSAEERKTYIAAAQDKGFEVVGYYFSSRVTDAKERNSRRDRVVPEVAILGTAARLERPGIEEGFDALYFVALGVEGFVVSEWIDGE